MDDKRLTQLLGTIHNNRFIPSDMTSEERKYCLSLGLIFHPQTEVYDIEPNKPNPSWEDSPKSLVVAELTTEGLARFQALLSRNKG